MSEDVRNSLYLWGGGIAFFLLSWAILQFDPFKGAPKSLFWGLIGLAAAVNLVRFLRRLQRRRSGPTGAAHD